MGGADIKEMVGLNPASAKEFITALYELCEAVRLFPAPTIARIDGWCIGVGLELAACCDMRYASASSQFTMPEVKIGIPSVIQGALLSRLIGEGRARWLMLSGNAIDAPTALNWGLLNGIETPEDLPVKVGEFAHELAACGAVGMRMQKQLLIEWEAPYLSDSVKQSIQRFGEVFESDEPHTYMSEFFRNKKKTA
jgi:enoyl-CoA hydratase/carnithine racemase